MPDPGASGPARERATVAVVGGGIAGLAAAWELTGGAHGPGPGSPGVVVLESARRLGGKLRTEELWGQPVDVGPDGFLARRPEATELCRELGLAEELEPIGASGAAVWARGRPRMLPEGLALGVPTRYWPVARSGILGWTSSLRLLLDVVAPRPDVRRPLGDRAIGPLVARKLGPGVVGTLVDPLVGGIHAGSVADMSAAAVYPLLLAVAQRRGSFMRALRRASAAQEPAPAAQRAEPAFWALRGGMGSLVARLAQRLGDRGVSVRVAAHVEKLSQVGGRAWVLHTSTGELAADAIVLAVPATSAASLLEPHEPEAAMLLRGVEHSSVAVVTMAYTARSLPATLRGTGLLVPAGTPAPEEVAPDGRFLVTACTYLSAKWPHLAAPDRVLVRASVGRHGDDRPSLLDDEALSARTARELRLLLGATGDPTDWHVTRWPDAFPQYRVHHLLRVAGIDAAVRRLPPLAVAGATYRGVGIPACVAGGRSAARQVLDALVRPGEVERSG